MAISRSPVRFLERAGLKDATFNPRPRLAVDSLLIHTAPVEPAALQQRILVRQEGSPPPDRGLMQPWPNTE